MSDTYESIDGVFCLIRTEPPSGAEYFGSEWKPADSTTYHLYIDPTDGTAYAVPANESETPS